MECYSCKSISGERSISPGPTIYSGEYWLIEHAYPCGMKGWLVIVLRRHASALYELTSSEFAELGVLLEKTASALYRATGCEKEYVACFSEAEHFDHVHFHIVAKSAALPTELKGPAIFKMLKVSAEEAVPSNEIAAFCEEMQASFK